MRQWVRQLPRWALVTLGTVIAASAGSFLTERVITGEISWATGSGGLAAVAVGGVMWLLGVRWQAWLAKKSSISMAAFAIQPNYNNERLNREVEAFATWVPQGNPHVRALPAAILPVSNPEQMMVFADRVESTILNEQKLRGNTSREVVLLVGGRLDACFYLGAALRNTTGIKGRIWLVNDCSDRYQDDYCHAARIDDLSQPADHRRERAPEPLKEHEWLTNMPGTPSVTFDESLPDHELYCRQARGWAKCMHEGEHECIVLGFEPYFGLAPDNRVSRALDRAPEPFPNPVLALTGMTGLGTTYGHYRQALGVLLQQADLARMTAVAEPRLYATVLGPAAMAAALGARLVAEGNPWTALAFDGKSHGYVVSPLRRGRNA